MQMNQALLGEYDQEMASARKTLERVPEDKFAWKPHAKSWPMVSLAQHVATIPTWGKIALDTQELDIDPPGGGPPRPEPIKSRAELLAMFDKNVADTRAAISAASDADLMKPWTLLKGGKKVMTLPKAAVWRGFVMNHLIHHRAQLGVYLRLNDVPVPSIYGPSADEGAF